MTPSWHTLSSEEALRRLGSGPSGLEHADAARRLRRYGPNRLARAEPVSALRILRDQFASVVVLLLAGAAAVALLLGELLESVAIGAVLAINTAIGFGVELRARRAMDALLRFEVPLARVVRAGTVELMPSDRLVPGDVLRIEEGDMVPADARIVSAAELRVDEAPLTGESIPVDKGAEPLEDPDTVLAERTPMLYSGTTVTAGRAVAVVVGTGAATEVGRIGILVAEVEAGKTPLEVRLDALGHRLVWLALATAAVVTSLGLLRGAPVRRMIEAGVALAIAAVPEGLPAVATIALAVGLRRMARRQALVRRLFAVESLGATTLVCTDKTGTLTAGHMTVSTVATADRAVSVTGEGFTTEGRFVEGGDALDPGVPWLHALLEAAALTSRATIDASGGEPLGDPTDAALLVLALKGGVDPASLLEALPEVGEIPFSSQRKASASIHDADGARIILAKGSPEVLLERSTSWIGADGERPLSPDDARRIRDRNEELAGAGLRVIALARGSGEELEGLTFLGLAGILDPPASGVRETIETLRRAGIRTVMVTGDQEATAKAIARDLGVLGEGETTLDGRALAGLSPEELTERTGSVGVFSRVSPEDKVHIVAALQARGEVVAMIGDGVNDAAALKKADIGVAMGGRGTDAAKQTAAMVLGDDRFLTIGTAVEEGRVIYENIRKFVFYLFSCNVAEVLVLFGASLAGTPIPVLPLQILWLNLVTDTFPALALSLEPPEPGIMERPPQDPRAAILSRRFLAAMGWYALLITGATLAAFSWGLTSGDTARATTIAFMTLALAQLFHLGNARSRGPVLSPARALANPWALASVPLVLGLQLLAVYWAPLSRTLGTVPLGTSDWLVVGGLSLLPAVVGQLVELVQLRRGR